MRGGHISEILKAHGYQVQSSDLVDRGYGDQADFLHKTDAWDGDIITNPPYKYAMEFVEQALKLTKAGSKTAMFLKLTFLEGEKRRSLFQVNPPKKIYVFTKRINCALNGKEEFFNSSSAVCYAWYIWEKGYKGHPEIDWI